MSDYGHELEFGVFLTPAASEIDRVLEQAQLAEVRGLDLVTCSARSTCSPAPSSLTWPTRNAS